MTLRFVHLSLSAVLILVIIPIAMAVLTLPPIPRTVTRMNAPQADPLIDNIVAACGPNEGERADPLIMRFFPHPADTKEP